MVEMLVREFVPQALAAGVDFSRLQRVNTKFHPGRGSARRREADVIWRLPTREGADIYLYLLCEFQRESDWWMAVRTQVYQGLLWQQIIQEQKLNAGARLPPLLSLVLHNGLTRWTAPTQISDLIALPRQSTLWCWQPQVRYHLLDMGAFPGDDLLRRNSLAALLFRLERPLASAETEGLLGEVKRWFRQHPDQQRLRHLFAELVGQALKGLGVEVPATNALLETKMESNFARIGEIWKQQALAEGRAAGLALGKAEGRALGKAEGRALGKAEGRALGKAEGIAEGKAEGKAEAKAEDLIYLLVARFGALAPALRTRIRRAKLATLERWFKRAITAPDVRSVFRAPR
jgi:hypothetical protein